MWENFPFDCLPALRLSDLRMKIEFNSDVLIQMCKNVRKKITLILMRLGRLRWARLMWSNGSLERQRCNALTAAFLPYRCIQSTHMWRHQAHASGDWTVHLCRSLRHNCKLSDLSLVHRIAFYRRRLSKQFWRLYRRSASHRWLHNSSEV